MKQHPHKLVLSFLFAATMIPGSSLFAGNTWDGGGSSGSWSDLSNWSSDTTPTSPTGLTFGGSSQLVSTNNLFPAGTQFNGFTFNAGAGAFVIGGNSITLGGAITNSSTSTQTINLDMVLSGTQTVALTTGGGNVALGGNLSGTGGITATGAGTLAISGSNSQTGDITFNANNGTLVLGHKNAVGLGSLVIGANNSFLQASADLSGSNKITNNVQIKNTVTVSGSNNVEIAGNFSLNAASGKTLGNNLDAGKTLILHDLDLNVNTTAALGLNLSGTGNTTILGTIANGNGVQANSLILTNSGTTRISGNNTYSGGTQLNTTGVVILGSKSALGTGAVTNNTSATFTLQASTDLSGANKIANDIAIQASITISGSNNIELGGKFSQNTNNSRTLTNNLDSGKLLTLNNVDINQNNSLRALTIAGTGDTSIVGVIANGASFANKLTITNTGVTKLSGSNTYTGATAVDGGMVVFANTSAKATGAVTASALGSIGLGVGGAGYYSSADVDSLFANTLNGFTMDAASGVGIDTSAGDFTYATNQSAARSLTKLGANKLILTGSNTYSGATTVKAGTLIVNGSVAGSGVTVNRGATLGGSGTISSQVTVKSGGTLSPGNSAGVATYSDGLTLENGSSFGFELYANSTSNRGADFDGVNVTGGTFTLESGVVFNISLNGAGSSTDYTAAFWDSNQSWLVFDNANTPAIAALFTLGTVSTDSIGNSFSVTGGNFSFSQSGNDVYLNYTTSIPEPSTWFLLTGGLTCALLMRRRRC